ncbi:MAG: hypothetical protein DRH15_00870, partial [Deltaproteobacteria bacterium]
MEFNRFLRLKETSSSPLHVLQGLVPAVTGTIWASVHTVARAAVWARGIRNYLSGLQIKIQSFL